MHKKIIGIASHDAGGAEILSHWLLSNNIKFKASLKGPSLNVYHKNIGLIKNYSVSELINQCNLLITSTSWQSNHELQAIKLAKEKGIYTISYIDHWCNYRERFLEKGIECLPNEIWVCDKYGLKIASSLFTNVVIKVVKNFYLEHIKYNVCKLDSLRINNKNKSENILFLAENIDDHCLARYGNTSHWGYNEKDAFLYFLRNLSFISTNVSKINIRLHPSHSLDSYEWTRRESKLINQIGCQNSLIEDLSNNQIFVGVQSMAMVAALYTGKKVVSCLPPNSNQIPSLPQTDIKYLRNIV